MINNIFLEQIKKYNPETIVDIKNAMKEVLQDIILSGLAKSDFFKYVAFYGGTSLRIFRGLPRFSENLDFTLIEEKNDFKLNDYFSFVKKELDSLFIKYEINDKTKNIITSVESSYFKFNLKELFEMTYPSYVNKIISNEILSIKVEVEKNFFIGGKVETKLLTFPSFIQVKTFTIETLFSSKLIAILNRKWAKRIKGRDFYDYLFYVSKNTKINFEFLKNGLIKFGYEIDKEYDINSLKKDLIKRFNEVDFENAKKDVLSFIKPNDPFINAFDNSIFTNTVDLLEIN